MQSVGSGMSEASLFEEFGISSSDLSTLNEQGLSDRVVFDQLLRFKFGFPPLTVDRPANARDGVYELSSERLDALVSKYQDLDTTKTVCKFVPASGAASRMFKDLLELQTSDADVQQRIAHFVDNLENFPFYQQLLNICPNLEDLIADKHYREILDWLLTDKGLNYQDLPKALLCFYQHPEGPKTVLEEHLEEAGFYAYSNGKARIHFTVSPPHLKAFQTDCNALIPKYTKLFGLQYEITFSVQKASTNTIAVGSDGLIFRDETNKPLTRAGGHGSLISNLNQIDADLIFVKNIDNIMPPGPFKNLMVKYKRVMKGLLIENQQSIFSHIHQLNNNRVSQDKIIAILKYLRNVLGLQFGEGFQELSTDERILQLKAVLNRPLRVCSVIRTDKPTGGGPFWVRENSGNKTVQILESAQMDSSWSNGNSKPQFAHITDMVCGVQDYQGNKFDLNQYVDLDAGFITEKSYMGEKIKVLEHPGLWNGCMSRWNTILIEIPDTIFHPVKSVWDLLRK